MNQLKVVSFQEGDVVTFKNPDIEHQLGKKTCEVMAVEGERVKLIEKGSSLNKPEHWIYAEIKNLKLFSESKKLTKTSLEVKSDEDVGQKNNNQSEIEKTSTPPSKDQQEISDLESNLTNLDEKSDEKSPTNSNEESDSKPSVNTISETNDYEQSPLNIDNKSEIKSSSDSANVDQNNQSPLNYSSESDPSLPRDSMMKTPNDNSVKPLADNKSADNKSKDGIIQSVPVDGNYATSETQSRCELHQETIEDYAESMESGVNFPPVILYFDGQKHYLADGFHRLEAAKRCGLLTINAEVRQGSKSDAILYSVGANANHGLRRTSADKRKAVETVLKNEEWRKWSDNEIAKRCGVSHPLVGRIRGELYPNTKSEERTYTNKQGNTTVMKTGNIGKKSNKSKKTENPENTLDKISSTLSNTQSSSNNINPPYSNQPVINDTPPVSDEQVTVERQSIAQRHFVIETLSEDANIIKEGNKDNKDVNGTMCSRTRDNDKTELSNNDTKNDRDNRQYVQRLKESFTFVKSEILAIVSSDQEIQITDALDLINGVLTNYLEKLS